MTSDYQAAVETAAAVLEAGVKRLQIAQALLTAPAAAAIPVELATDLIATYDQLDAALARLLGTLHDDLVRPQPTLPGAPVRVDCKTTDVPPLPVTERGWL